MELRFLPLNLADYNQKLRLLRHRIISTAATIMSRNGSSSSSRPPTPAFLKPTRDSLAQILTTLYEREQLRRSLGQQSRLLAAAATSSHSQASAGWYSVAVGTLPGNVNKNRCVASRRDVD